MMLFLRYLNTMPTNKFRRDNPAWQGKKKELNDNSVWMLPHISKEYRIFQFICNTKGTQTETSTVSSATLRLDVNFNQVLQHRVI